MAGFSAQINIHATLVIEMAKHYVRRHHILALFNQQFQTFRRHPGASRDEDARLVVIRLILCAGGPGLHNLVLGLAPADGLHSQSSGDGGGGCGRGECCRCGRCRGGYDERHRHEGGGLGVLFYDLRGDNGAMGELRLLGENGPFRAVVAGKIQPDSVLTAARVAVGDGKFGANVADGTLIPERERPRLLKGRQLECEIMNHREFGPLAAAPCAAHQVNGEQGRGILHAGDDMVEHMALGDVAAGGAGSEFP